MSACPAGQAPAQWDAIVVGAGPAGCALARRLRPGLRVLLLDRPAGADTEAARIGESLPGAARLLLQRLDILDRFLAQGHVERGALVSHWHADQPVWFDALRDPHGNGWHLDRRRFDAGLREAALAAGAALIEDVERTRVAHEAGRWRVDLQCRARGAAGTPDQTHYAKVLVDASGTRMSAARQLGLARQGQDRLMAVYAHLPVSEYDKDHVTRTCADRNGWWYSVRVPSGHRVLAFHLDSDDADIGALRDAAALLAKCRRHPLLESIRPATDDVPVRVQPARGGWLEPDALAALPPGFFAVGDAMLAFDPIASQGIFNALATAESAALAIRRHLDGIEGARDRYLDELRAVLAQYRRRRRDTYGAVARFAGERFWLRRTSRHP